MISSLVAVVPMIVAQDKVLGLDQLAYKTVVINLGPVNEPKSGFQYEVKVTKLDVSGVRMVTTTNTGPIVLRNGSYHFRGFLFEVVDEIDLPWSELTKFYLESDLMPGPYLLRPPRTMAKSMHRCMFRYPQRSTQVLHTLTNFEGGTKVGPTKSIPTDMFAVWFNTAEERQEWIIRLNKARSKFELGPLVWR